MSAIQDDPYLGRQPAPPYVLKRRVGSGRIGTVYEARREDPADTLACKVIPEGRLKPGWQRELEKLTCLRGIPHVVPYHSHGTFFDGNQRACVYVLFDFIPGQNLTDYCNDVRNIELAFIESLAVAILTVLVACKAKGIVHGDLHAGNILISDPDSRLPGKARTIWLADFGYGGSHNEIEPKDDYRQASSICKSLLRAISPAELNASDRILHRLFDEFFTRNVLEEDRTQGAHVRTPERLLGEFRQLRSRAELEAAAASSPQKLENPGDYLSAETLGTRPEEWRALFVPSFLAASDLLSRNTTILTGARGCGKTMVFRRLTAFMDHVIGEPSGVEGADDFVGFYINCRDFAEAFPWLPHKLSPPIEQQLMHFFHLAWLGEICRTLALYRNKQDNCSWLDGFLHGLYAGQYSPLPGNGDCLGHVGAFVETQKEQCRTQPFGKREGLSGWPLARTDFLDTVAAQLQAHATWIRDRPLYFFLDDYTVPLVPRAVQRVLNQVVFKRRSHVFFKLATEATNSIELSSRLGKPLELHQDFELIDLATECLHKDSTEKRQFLDRLFRPRIARHPAFAAAGLGLSDVLGSTRFSGNDLARQMRDAVQHGKRKRIYYHGIGAFAGLWTSDVRIMIQMLVDMLRESDTSIKRGVKQIPTEVQDKTFRAAGGELLELITKVVDPTVWSPRDRRARRDERYGEHLKEIVESFVNVSRFEMTKGELVSNQGRRNPKQAFRMEITDRFDLPASVRPYYEGLIRWHIFLQDWRGKSVQGMLTPRLYLNRALIPYCNLSFSSHDNIHLRNEEFINLLRAPTEFFQYWERKRGQKHGKKRLTASQTDPQMWDE